jgi:uncharacterized membrane protein YjjP (DUF1212 family)
MAEHSQWLSRDAKIILAVALTLGGLFALTNNDDLLAIRIAIAWIAGFAFFGAILGWFDKRPVAGMFKGIAAGFSTLVIWIFCYIKYGHPRM